MTIKILIDETHSTPEEREAFYQQPTIGKALDELAYHSLPGVELRVLSRDPSQETRDSDQVLWLS